MRNVARALTATSMDAQRMTGAAYPNKGLVLALGGGGAAGLAHIGVLQVLQEHAIPVRAVVGTSIGAEIGAFVASGMAVDDLAALAMSFDWKQTLQLFMPDLPTGGLVSGVNIVEFLRGWIGVQQIEDLTMGYAAVATDLKDGSQVVLDSGDLVSAVRASIAIPAFIAPFHSGQRSLVDGGVVNPLPFDVARTRFGGPVVAVAVHAGARAPAAEPSRSPLWPKRAQQLLAQPWMARVPAVADWIRSQLNGDAGNREPAWTTRRVLDRIIGITEAEILRLRAEINPPDLMLVPDVGRTGFLEFYRARETIAAGRHATEKNLAALKKLARGKRQSARPAARSA
jgi:NTE family protein